jgi:hypothetical protein
MVLTTYDKEYAFEIRKNGIGLEIELIYKKKTIILLQKIII